MSCPHLLPHLVLRAADQHPDARALTCGAASWSYRTLADHVQRFADALLRLGLSPNDRVAVYMEKRLESVAVLFGAAEAGGIAVPVHAVAKPHQLRHVLDDCSARFLVTSARRLPGLADVLADSPSLRAVIVVDAEADDEALSMTVGGPERHSLSALLDGEAGGRPRRIETDPAAIFYTSGSTGRPRGVVVTHRNLVAGARSVASYLGNVREDHILAVLPLSFDAGFSQLTTGFLSGARVVLHEYLLPLDVLKISAAEEVTGITAVPSFWIRLSHLGFPPPVRDHLRYIASTGGHLPRATVERLGAALPRTSIFLMYGLTEGFRATYLPPSQLDRRPGSIGRAIPNVDLHILREDGSPCAPGEVGELVQRGPLVTLGYWNDPELTRERFRPLPEGLRPGIGSALPAERALYSGDLVWADEEGFLHFVGRRDAMIKTSGYRVSPTEIEDAVQASGLVVECVAFGVPHEVLGEEIGVVVRPVQGGEVEASTILDICRQGLPTHMVPRHIFLQDEPFPVGRNGKIDRRALLDLILPGKFTHPPAGAP